MYPLALCLIVSSLLALASLALPGGPADRAHERTARCEAVADNFLLFRSAAQLALNEQAKAHPNLPAALTRAQVEAYLPPGYVALGPWQVTGLDARIFVYGARAQDTGNRFELLAFHVRRRLNNSLNAGQCRSSRLHPAGTALPKVIPEGSVVCVLSPQE